MDNRLTWERRDSSRRRKTRIGRSADVRTKGGLLRRARNSCDEKPTLPEAGKYTARHRSGQVGGAGLPPCHRPPKPPPTAADRMQGAVVRLADLRRTDRSGPVRKDSPESRYVRLLIKKPEDVSTGTAGLLPAGGKEVADRYLTGFQPGPIGIGPKLAIPCAA